MSYIYIYKLLFMKKLNLLVMFVILFASLSLSVNAADIVEDTWDGWSITTKDDWTVITKFADGTVETVKPDWSSKTVNPDGSTTSISADWETTETPPTLKSADAIWDIFDAVTNDNSNTSSETTNTTKTTWWWKINFTKPPEEDKASNNSNANSNSSSSNETKQVSNVNVKKLPQTWPTEILLMLFSFVLAWVVLYKRKK